MKKKLFYFLSFLFISFNSVFANQIVVEEDDWPCELHHLKTPIQSDYWPNKKAVLDSKWKDDTEVKELVNFKSKNGKLVKTFGAKALEICNSISGYAKSYEVEKVIVYPNDNFQGNKYRYVVLLKNSKTGKLITLFDRGI